MSGLRLEVGDFAARIEQRRRTLLASDFPGRLAAGDDTLWGADDRTRSVARNRCHLMTRKALDELACAA